MSARSVDSGVPTMVNILSPVSSWGTLAIEILDPDNRRISVILDPPRPLLISLCTCAGSKGGDSHDTSDHVTGNGDVLGSEVGVVHVDGSFTLSPLASSSGESRRSGGDTSPASSPVSTKGTSAESSSDTSPPDSTSGTSDGLSSKSTSQDAGVSSSSRVVLDGTLSSVPVLYQTFGNLQNGSLDGLDSSLNFNDSLGRLRKHFLGSDHSSTGLILNLLDLQSGSTNDGTHEVVGDQQSNGGEGADRRRRKGGVGQGGLEQKSSDLGESGSDTFDLSRDGENSILNTSDDLGNTSLYTSSVSDLSNGSSAFTDDDTGFFGRDESSEGEGMFLAVVVVDSVRSFEGRILGGLGGDGFCLCKLRVMQRRHKVYDMRKISRQLGDLLREGF